MQENRSLRPLLRHPVRACAASTTRTALDLPNGRSVFHQPDPANPDGYLLPFRLDTTTTSARRRSRPPSHAWASSTRRGTAARWTTGCRRTVRPTATNGPYTMGYFTREDIPFHYALADAFTVCDHYHCSVLGPTGPNRLHVDDRHHRPGRRWPAARH